MTVSETGTDEKADHMTRTASRMVGDERADYAGFTRLCLPF